MALEMSQFHEAFFAEAFESLDVMEKSLLELDPGAPNAETINSIFRVAHSIKGGSGMFGFNHIASFTHTLETLLDELRAGRMAVTAEIIDLLLKSTDILRGMLHATQRNAAVDEQVVADVQFDLELLVAKGGAAAAPAAAPAAATQPPSDGRARWQVTFKPNARMLLLGNDAARLLGELAELGELRVSADTSAVPALSALDPEVCYLSWQAELATERDEAAIRAVFEWVEGDCELQVTQLAAASPSVAGAPAAVAVPAVATAAPAAPAPATPAATAAVQPVAAPVSGPQAPVVDAAAAAPARVAARPGPAAVPAGEKSTKAAAGDANSIRVSIEKIDELMNTVGEIVITQSMLSQLAASVDAPRMERVRNGLQQLERHVRELQDSVMRVRMLPISFAFSRFPRLVRDLSQRLGKQIELKMTGENTELDKTVLERIGDPLVHLVRNSIDHGIEQPDVRVAAGKSPSGTLHLDAYHRGGSIVIEVSDDGAGLNRERILAKARSKGLVGASDVLSDDEVANLIFLPGFSTAEQTTDLSGRGVGMDVVRRNIKELGGTVSLHSESGKGSRIVINLPLTLAIVDGQSVAVGEEIYIIPLVTIVESLQLKRGMVSRLVGQGEVFSFRGEYIPIVRLHQVFDVEPRHRDLERGLVMVVEGDGRKVGLFVDELLGQQQVVIKSMETNYQRVDGVSGATILGEGSVALILDVPGLVRVAGERQAA